MTAWKLKDITALENVISDDYMAVNFEGKVGDKENEIATAKTDPEWISMAVDEIHTREFGKTAIASVSSPRKERGRMEISSAQRCDSWQPPTNDDHQRHSQDRNRYNSPHSFLPSIEFASRIVSLK